MAVWGLHWSYRRTPAGYDGWERLKRGGLVSAAFDQDGQVTRLGGTEKAFVPMACAGNRRRVILQACLDSCLMRDEIIIGPAHQKGIMTVEYKLSPPATNEQLNALFLNAWPDSSGNRDFAPVLERSLGYVCAYQHDELIGFVYVAWDGGIHAFLLEPTVRSDCRRRGIGSGLVCHAEELARTKGAEWLHVDFDSQLAMFYRKCGFRESCAGLIDLTECTEPRTV